MAAAADTLSELLLPPVSPAFPAARLHAVAEGEAGLALAVAEAEQEVAARRLDRALAALAPVQGELAAATPLALRALLVASQAHLGLGDVDAAVSLLTRARAITERPGFTEVDRAEALFRLACCRLAANEVVNALALLTHALDLCDRSLLPCDRLRADILERRSRCHQRQRDWAAARADVERGLELAQALDDRPLAAALLFQASIVAERERQWLLARFYAEEAREAFEALDDPLNASRVLNNLGGIVFLLGEVAEAKAFLRRSHALAVAAGDDLAAGYARSSLAQVHLRTGEAGEAEREAKRALALLADRPDHAAEVGNAQLVLARALVAQGRDAEADAAFDAAAERLAPLGSAGHVAAVWIARGDALAGRGRPEEAAALYRRAAVRLQDVHF